MEFFRRAQSRRPHWYHRQHSSVSEIPIATTMMSFGILKAVDFMKSYFLLSIVPTEHFAIFQGHHMLTHPRIFQIPKLGQKLKQDSIPLSYTPRKFITHPTNHYFYMIEGDHRVLGQDAIAKKVQRLVGLSSIRSYGCRLTVSSKKVVSS